MDAADEQDFLNEMLPTLEETFHEFLADPHQILMKEDTALARVTFYRTLLEVMREDPMEDDEEGMQEVLEKRVIEMRDHHEMILDQQIKNILQ